jgi:Enoyl-CoA hydratase/isomerase
VGWIEHDRPPVNAFNWEMLREVPEALDRHLGDPAVRVVVFGSALDAHFSVGADLRVFSDMDAKGMRRWVDVCHGLVRSMRSSPKPLLAAVHRIAVGGGLERARGPRCPAASRSQGLTVVSASISSTGSSRRTDPGSSTVAYTPKRTAPLSGRCATGVVRSMASSPR